MSRKVLVALSGGIDSAMTACLLKENGYEVTGVNFIFFDQESDSIKAKLAQISRILEIKIISYDARALFNEKVIKYYTKTHLEGRTPSPCVICNPEVKWKLLAQLADEKSIENISTGHYVRLISEGGKSRMYKGEDTAKDQSYYLWGLRQNILSRALCPLGDLKKEQVKELAFEQGFKFLQKEKESTGLCFADQKNYYDLLTDKLKGSDLPGPGNVVNRKGEKIGRHRGYIYYTIGQKKDFDLDVSEKLCVVDIDPINNILVADTWQSLYGNSFTIGDCYFPDEEELKSGIPIQTIVRGFGLNPAGNTKFTRMEDDRFFVELENPAWAITKGQPAVFYSGEKLIGGGLVM